MKKWTICMTALIVLCAVVMTACNDTPVIDEILSETKETEAVTEETTETTEPVDPTADLPETTVYLIGGSVLCDYPYDLGYFPRYSIAPAFSRRLYKKATVQNLGYLGGTAASFHRNENYTKWTTELKEGDYVLLMFGYDEYMDATKDYTESRSFANTIYERYIQPAQEVGAVPVLCTPIVKLSSENDYTGSAAHVLKSGDYPQAIRDLAAAVDVPLIDLTAITKAKYEELGYEEAMKYHAVEEAMRAEDGVTMIMDPATVDDSFLNFYGAEYMGYLLAAELQKFEGIGDYVRKDIAEPSMDELTSNPVYVLNDMEDAKANIYLVGDSISAVHSCQGWQVLYGYGNELRYYMTGDVKINNYAVSGSSSSSYTGTDYYSTILENIKEGDYLFIAFGHNDKTNDYRFTDATKDYTDPTAFSYYLYEYYIKAAREKGAIPILFTPIVYLHTGDGEYTGFYIHDVETGNYPQAIRDLGETFDVPVVDLTTISKERYEELGYEGAVKYHPVAEANYAEDGATVVPDMSTLDSCHLNQYGARYMAYRIACELQKIEGISEYVVETPEEPTEEVLQPNPYYVLQPVN
ncbi:MAG: hypothetical protein E7658_05560 [Ruminococcaceae bacterium]|nr:hypothetical protein [Oscillospiraceae bacterium]